MTIMTCHDDIVTSHDVGWWLKSITSNVSTFLPLNNIFAVGFKMKKAVTSLFDFCRSDPEGNQISWYEDWNQRDSNDTQICAYNYLYITISLSFDGIQRNWE